MTIDVQTTLATAKSEEPIAGFVPYSSHPAKHVVKLHSGDYVATLCLQGAAHESADVADINMWHEQLHGLLRNMASPHVAIWSHVVRRTFGEYPDGDFPPGFAKDLNDKYRTALAGMPCLVNELYLSIVYRPQAQRAGRVFDLFSRKAVEETRERQLEDLQAVDDLIDTALAALDRYEPELLGCYEHKGTLFSSLCEFLGFLVNGEWSRFPLPRGDIARLLPTTRPLFGKGGLFALKGPTSLQYGAVLDIQQYPSITCPGILNDLLGMPFEFVLSQSFTFLAKQTALGRMKRQHARMVNAGDVAVSQVDEIEQAMDDLGSDRIAMGVHHLSLIIRADSQKALTEHVSDAGTALSDAGIKWAREDIGMAGAYWAQLPGNFQYRVRAGDITSRNFAGFSAFHNYPTGRLSGNQWGDAVTVFRTAAGGQYAFNWHKGEEGFDAKRAAKADPNHKDLATALVVGPSGTGKTVTQLFLLAQTQKFNNPGTPGGNRLSAVFFDKDLGASVAIRAMGGRYHALKNGVATHWNPFQLPITPGNLVFLEKLVRRLVKRDDEPLTPAQEKVIADAVAGVMNDRVPRELRRLRAILEFLQDVNDPNGLHARLSRWAGPAAPNGWLFDNADDTLDVAAAPIVGFDVTEFLPNDETREPTIMYLFHRVESLLDGRRVPIFFDEFGQLVKDKSFQELVENKLVTIRKQDGFLVMGTQMPGQVINSPIAGAIVQQTATMILLPNPKADRHEYVDGFKLTRREFEIVKSLGEKSRQFLVKQGRNSVVCEFKLKAFEDELAVLSGNTATAKLAQELVEQLGDDPNAWLPEFHRLRHANVTHD
jgi:type IV secretion system protein VirB4